jgi:hypothetical protein
MQVLKALSISVAALLTSCASQPSEVELELLPIFTGKVVMFEAVRGGCGQRSQGIYRPGMYGAAGGLVVGILEGGGYCRYAVQRRDGTTRSFATPSWFEHGSCVEVFIKKGERALESKEPGIHALRSSTECTN